MILELTLTHISLQNAVQNAIKKVREFRQFTEAFLQAEVEAEADGELQEPNKAGLQGQSWSQASGLCWAAEVLCGPREAIEVRCGARSGQTGGQPIIWVGHVISGDLILRDSHDFFACGTFYTQTGGEMTGCWGCCSVLGCPDKGVTLFLRLMSSVKFWLVFVR